MPPKRKVGKDGGVSKLQDQVRSAPRPQSAAV